MINQEQMEKDGEGQIAHYADKAIHYLGTTDIPVTTDPAWVHGCMQELWSVAYTAGVNAEVAYQKEVQRGQAIAKQKAKVKV